MPTSKGEAHHAQKSIEKERGNAAARRQTDRFQKVEPGGIWQATTASRVADETLQSGSVLAEAAQEIATAWAHYAEEIMRHTAEANQALLRARTLTEMLEAQGILLRNTMQAFVEQSARIAGAASRMTTVPFHALRQASAEQTRR